MSSAAAGEMMVTAAVSRMADHSATVACRNRGHSESGIKCRKSSSFQVILVAVQPVNPDPLKLTFSAIVMCTTEEIRPHFLEKTNWFTDVFPRCDHLWVCFNPHVFRSRNCDRRPVSRFVSSGPSDGPGRILQPRALRWRLISTFRVVFSFLVARWFSFSELFRGGQLRILFLMVRRMGRRKCLRSLL